MMTTKKDKKFNKEKIQQQQNALNWENNLNALEVKKFHVWFDVDNDSPRCETKKL